MIIPICFEFDQRDIGLTYMLLNIDSESSVPI